MASVGKGYTFGSTEQVTNTKLHSLVDSATVTAIVNNDIDASAAILESKVDFHESTGHNHDGTSSDGTKVDLSAPNVIGGTTPADGTFDALVGTTIDGPIGSVTPAAIIGTTLKGNTSLEIATGATVTGILDEDAMGTDSATQLATQQSIKAYVDSFMAAVPLWSFALSVEDVSSSLGIGDHENFVSGTALGWFRTGTSYAVILQSKLKKMANIDTITWYCLIQSSSATKDPYVSVSVGGQSSEAFKAEDEENETWVTNTIDISSLTTGTVYDVEISLKNADASEKTWMYSAVAFGS